MGVLEGPSIPQSAAAGPRSTYFRIFHDVEIVADRGIDAKVGTAGWEKICREMEAKFRADNFESGVIDGIDAVSRELATHFPAHGPIATTAG